MEMTNNEIVHRYKNGAYAPKRMVEILAELNACDKKDIVKILFDAGELSGQAIYQYRKSGLLEPATVDEADELPNEEPEQQELPESGCTLPAPEAIVLDIIDVWLRERTEDYNACKTFCERWEATKEWYEIWKC